MAKQASQKESFFFGGGKGGSPLISWKLHNTALKVVLQQFALYKIGKKKRKLKIKFSLVRLFFSFCPLL